MACAQGNKTALHVAIEGGHRATALAMSEYNVAKDVMNIADEVRILLLQRPSRTNCSVAARSGSGSESAVTVTVTVRGVWG